MILGLYVPISIFVILWLASLLWRNVSGARAWSPWFTRQAVTSCIRVSGWQVARAHAQPSSSTSTPHLTANDGGSGGHWSRSLK